MRSGLRVVAAALLCLGHPGWSLAQGPLDESESARFRLGALRFTPSIAVSNVGVDSNVFNESVNPKQDTTAAVGPAVSLWMKLGGSRLSGKLAGQYLYFKEYASQRSWNSTGEGRWDVPLSRITPFITGQLHDTRDRTGYEIDARVRLREERVGLGSSVRVSGKTDLVIAGRRTWIKYDQNDFVVGDLISHALDRRTDAAELQLRTRLTPLTTLVVRTEAAQDRFVYQEYRNADSISLVPGFELKPQALISGQAFVGIRHFNALSERVPDYTGLVANVGARFLAHRTQFDVRATRDLAYSYEELQPYYTQSDLGLTVTQRVTSQWDLVGRVGRQRLSYKNVLALSELPDRTDHSWQAGGGIGYRFAESLRLGLDANYYSRQAPTRELRNYEGLRIGASFSYGLTQ